MLYKIFGLLFVFLLIDLAEVRRRKLLGYIVSCLGGEKPQVKLGLRREKS
jgi:hypothetical protein